MSSEVSQRDTGMINGNSGSVPKRTACLSQIIASECERRWAVVDACPLVTMSSMRGGESISTENDCFPLLVGFVRFEPEERKVRGKVVREIRLRPFAGSEDELVWLWPEFAHVPVTEGDLLALQGQRESWYREDVADGKVRSFETLNVRTLFRLPAEQPIPGV